MHKSNRRTCILHGGKILSGLLGLFLLFGGLSVFAQSCQLLPGRNPSTLADGQSKTGYISANATYTQTCAQQQGIITCANGTLTNGNIYRYPSCTPHTWANCTTPAIATHLSFAPLYKLSLATPLKSCSSVKQDFQCINGTFTGVGVSLYPFGTCTDPNRAPCVNSWTNTFVNNAQTIIGYTNNHPIPGQTCATQQRILTCVNGTWSGGTQSSMYPNCASSGTLASCYNIWTQTGTLNGVSIVGYTASQPTIVGQTCLTLQKSLTCINGIRSGGNQSNLHPTCTPSPTLGACYNIWTQTGVANGSHIMGYSAPQPTLFGQSCLNLQRPLTCVNGTWTGGNQASLYSGCTNTITAGSCFNIRSQTGVMNGGFIVGYTQGLAMESNNQHCSTYDVTLQCINGTRSGGDQNSLASRCVDVSSGSCYNPLNFSYVGNHQSIYTYTSPSATIFSGCNDQLKHVTCENGTRTGGGVVQGNISNMSLSCNNCHLPRGAVLNNGSAIDAFANSGVDYPQSCTDVKTVLSCNGSTLNGNRQTYQYPSCVGFGQLTGGVDIGIVPTFSGLPGGRTGMAQKASPVITLVLRNGGLGILNGSASPGFLSCIRNGGGQVITLYSSPAISSLIINSGTKLEANVKLNSVFTQSLGVKTIVCSLKPSLFSPSFAGTDISSNNIWSGSFEVMEASRFDLAMSRSIESIRKNLEAAEGVLGTQGVQNFVYSKVMDILVPLIVVIGILISLIGFYKIMFSAEEKATTEGTNYIIYGLLGIIVIMSAKFIGSNIYNILTPTDGNIKGYQVAQQLYSNIIFPFIKFAMYLVLGAMFVILVSRVITFVFGTDSDAKKKAGTLIGWNVLGMLVIIGAKQIVEAVFGKQQEVIKDISNLGEIGSGILADKNIPLIYQVVNWVLGLTALVILIVIIVQTIMLLTSPSDEKQTTNLKKSILYMIIGMFVIGIGYLIVNFLVIN